MTFSTDYLIIGWGPSPVQVTYQHEQTSFLPVWLWNFRSLFLVFTLKLLYFNLLFWPASPKGYLSFLDQWLHSKTQYFGKRERKKRRTAFNKILLLRATWSCLSVLCYKASPLLSVKTSLNKKEKCFVTFSGITVLQSYLLGIWLSSWYFFPVIYSYMWFFSNLSSRNILFWRKVWKLNTNLYWEYLISLIKNMTE